jgi:hypothetical protein
MARNSSQPSLEALKQAIVIAEEIQRLEAALAAILSGTSYGVVKGKRRGRPAKPVVEVVGKATKTEKGD